MRSQQLRHQAHPDVVYLDISRLIPPAPRGRRSGTPNAVLLTWEEGLAHAAHGEVRAEHRDCARRAMSRVMRA